jgi:mycothiol synthase
VTNSDYIIRNYRPADFDGYVRLQQEAEKLEQIRRPASPQDVAERLKHPDYTPEHDLFLAEADGNLIGYLEIMPEFIIKRGILSCWIHPGHRRKGLATKFLDCAIKRAGELGLNVLHVNVSQDNKIAISVLSKLGFRGVRRYLELRLDMDRIQWQDIDRVSLGCRHLLPGEEDKLALIQNRAFAGHWGYNPNRVDEIVYDANRGNHSPEDIVVTCEGDKLTGYCWTEVTASGGTASQEKGQIYMIGTDPDYRGTGVGKRVLLAGLFHLQNKGMKVTTLTVDSENKAACALYESIGFEVRTTSLWYEKKVD